MLSRRCILLAGLAWPWAAAWPSMPAEVAAELPDARRLGSGRLTFLGLHVYDAHLWVGDGFDAARYEQAPLALELEYVRSLAGRKIAERSLKEMRRSAPIPPAQAEAWLAEMTRMFPDVGPTDRLTGVQRPGRSVRFLFNGRLIGELNDAAFARRFFGIWLAPQTSEPGLRRALLGEPAGKG